METAMNAYETYRPVGSPEANTIEELALSRVYPLFQRSPVAVLTTAHRGNVEIATILGTMLVNWDPPQFACVVCGDKCVEAMRATLRCVVAIPDVKLAPQVVRLNSS